VIVHEGMILRQNEFSNGYLLLDCSWLHCSRLKAYRQWRTDNWPFDLSPQTLLCASFKAWSWRGQGGQARQALLRHHAIEPAASMSDFRASAKPLI